MIQVDFVFITEVIEVDIDKEVFGIESNIADGVIIKGSLVILGII